MLGDSDVAYGLLVRGRRRVQRTLVVVLPDEGRNNLNFIISLFFFSFSSSLHVYLTSFILSLSPPTSIRVSFVPFSFIYTFCVSTILHCLIFTGLQHLYYN